MKGNVSKTNLTDHHLWIQFDKLSTSNCTMAGDFKFCPKIIGGFVLKLCEVWFIRVHKLISVIYWLQMLKTFYLNEKLCDLDHKNA